MAEGPAVVRWARALGQLIGEPLLEIHAPRRWRERAARLVGASVVDVETRGKHLLIRLSTGDVIHAHAMQFGSWQVGVPGMALRKAPRFVRLKLRTANHEAVYYHGPVMEILTQVEISTHESLTALGPDIMQEAFDAREAGRRLRRAAHREIGDAILDQRIVAGIGNIFKSEGLFLARIDPRRPARAVSHVARERLWNALRPIMRASVVHIGPTITRHAGDERHWVYRRRGHPCLACGSPIAMIRQGELLRATYYCPNCQRPPKSRARRAAPARHREERPRK